MCVEGDDPVPCLSDDVQMRDKITISKQFKENVIRPILKVQTLPFVRPLALPFVPVRNRGCLGPWGWFSGGA